jgi:hypothetical protein
LVVCLTFQSTWIEEINTKMVNDPKQLIRELVEEVLKEMTATGGVAGYMTPNAFRGHKSKKKSAERSIPGGTVVGTEDESDDTTIGESSDNQPLPTVRRSLSEDRNRYRNFKNSDLMKTHTKISYGIQEAKKMLSEVEYLLGICERLKTEADVPNNDLWARTRPNMRAIHQRLKEIARRINRMKN